MDRSLVETRDGTLAGTRVDGLRVFKGVPYACAPVGELRFRAPRRPEPWTGARDAIAFGAMAPQLPSPLEQLFGAPATGMSEDCLFLNVWTPGTDDARRPVMVWIHGGAFVMGQGSTPWYDGSRFAIHGDVVVVTINYRLGAFGFLGLDELGGEEYAGSGNAGILDQMAALEWVRDNVAAFGGDPGNVTIFGESAGAMSVGTLLGTPGAQGLFHRAILQSGAASYVHPLAQATAVAEQLLAAGEMREVAELQARPTGAVLEAQATMLAADGKLSLPFRPVVDGTVLPAVPLESIAAGRTGDVPILEGTTRDEMTLFLLFEPALGELDGRGLTERAAEMLGEGAAHAVEAYRRNRPDAPLRDLLVAIASDGVFRVPGIRLAEAQVHRSRPAFSYLFTWPTPALGGALKSCHGLEIPFVFDNLDRGGVSFLTGDGPERTALATAMHTAWIAFAHSGDPGWPAYELETRPTRVFDGRENPVVDDPMGDERALWNAVPLS